MPEFHVRREQMERFLRSELSRRENREIVRHLLAACEICQVAAREAARREGFKVPLEQEPPPRLRIARAV